MLKQTLKIAAILFLFTSCGNSKESNNTADSKTAQEAVTTSENNVENALTFINAYVENANKMNKAVDMVDWVNSNELATKNFRTELKRIVDEAKKQDPELGLDADPIVDAQDYPSEGFELESFDDKTNFVIVKGKNMPEFKLTMKMIKENDKWLVDGCGIINIPNDKKSSR